MPNKEFQLALENFISEIQIAEENALTDTVSGASRSVSDLLQKMQTGLKDRLKTKKDCDDYLKIIDKEAEEFNTNLKTIQKYEIALKKNEIDKKTFAEKVAPHIDAIKEKCHSLKIRLGSVVKDPENPTDEDLSAMKQLIVSLRKAVVDIKNKLSDKIAKESDTEDKDRDTDCDEDECNNSDNKDSDDEDDEDNEDEDAVESALESLSQIINETDPSFDSFLDIFK